MWHIWPIACSHPCSIDSAMQHPLDLFLLKCATTSCFWLVYTPYPFIVNSHHALQPLIFKTLQPLIFKTQTSWQYPYNVKRPWNGIPSVLQDAPWRPDPLVLYNTWFQIKCWWLKKDYGQRLGVCVVLSGCSWKPFGLHFGWLLMRWLLWLLRLKIKL